MHSNCSDAEVWEGTPLYATAQHIVNLARKIEQLQIALNASWDQLLAAAKRNNLTPAEQEQLFILMSTTYGPGFMKAWDAADIGPKAGNMKYRTRPSQREQSAPNGPNGTWIGDFPITPDVPVPCRGVPVVYVLFNSGCEPIYVGSTSAFLFRMRAHRDKGATRWQAYPCVNREAAYELEVELLKQHKPSCNKRAGR